LEDINITKLEWYKKISLCFRRIFLICARAGKHNFRQKFISKNLKGHAQWLQGFIKMIFFKQIKGKLN